MDTEDQDTLRRYVESVTVPLVNTDNEKYPIRAGRVAHIFLADFVLELVADLKELKNSGLGYLEIGRLFGNPTRIMRMSHHVLRGAKKAGFSLEEQKRLILELIEVVKTMKSGNVFNEDKKNILLDDDEIKRMLKKNDFIEPTEDTSRLVHRLCGVMWAYSEAPYFVAHGVGMEEHGPYELQKERVIIRDFFNLKPMELWGACKDLPFHKIRITCIYDKSYDVEFDVYGNSYPKKGNPVLSLKSYHIEADDRPLATGGMEGVLDVTPNIIESITKEIESMSEKQIAKKYADIFWYRKKPLRDYLNRDWRPPEVVYKNIEEGEIKPEIKKSSTPEDIRKSMGLI